MDEVLFRSGQKFENLQIRTEIIAAKAKDALIIYSQAGKTLILRIWDSTPILQARDVWKEGIIRFSVLVEKTKIKILEVADLKILYHTLINVFSKKWTKRDMYFGCSGLIIGIAIGLAVGICIKRREQVVRYMQAVQCLNYSGVESVIVAEDALAPYECDDYDVMVNVNAASIQFIDAEICSGYGRTLRAILSNLHKELKQPVILGRDCSGTIVDVGRRVNRVEVGDEVWLTMPFWAQGTLCQTIVAPENRVSRKPKNIAFEGASSLPYAGSWALAVLKKAGIDCNTAQKKRILVQGGCSPVGCVLIQLLSKWKASVTTMCYKRAMPVAKALGASDILVLTESSETINDHQQQPNQSNLLRDDLLNQLKLRGDIFDLIFITKRDCVEEKDLISFLSPNGLVLSTLPPILVSDSCGFVTRFFLNWYIHIRFLLKKLIGLPETNFDETHLCYATLDALSEYVEDGLLQTVVDKIYQSHDVELALYHIQSPRAIGSTVITFK